MSDPVKSMEIKHVNCEVCLSEVPSSEVPIEEAGDYVLYFCGLDCYKKWRERYDQESVP